MPRVVHFELPAEDVARAVQFYESVFGWQFQKWGGPQEYWLIKTGEEGTMGINGGLSRRMEGFPANAPINVLDVTSVDDYVEKIQAAGGTITVPKMPIPGVGYLAYAQDTEGVIFGIMQEDLTAV